MVDTYTHTHTHTPKPVRENGDVTVIMNQRVSTNTEATANRPDILIKNEENMHTVRCGNTSEQECHAKGCKKKF